MDHEAIMTRQLLATIVILACGLVPDRLSGDGPSRLRDILKSNLFNRVDLERIESGYYEQLLDAGRRLDDLADVPGLRIRRRSGSTWSIPVDDAPLIVRVDDLREVVLKRDDATERWGLQWRTNAQGMRDRPYATDKPVGTFRIALVGDSIGAGWGVNVEQRFESILEQLWHDRAKETSGLMVEIINCAVPGHSPGQRWYHFGQIGWPMDPDLVIYESTAADVGWDERRLRYLLARGLGWDSPIYHRALVKAGVEPHGSPDDYKRVLRPRHWDILAGVYQTMAADCRARGLPILWVLVPRVGRKNDGADQRTLVKSARTAGFSRVIDVTDAYDDMDSSRLAIEPHDFHPNASGHARLAERLDSALRELPELGRLWKPSPEEAYHRDSTPRLDVVSDALRGKVETAVPWPSPGGKPR
ncbi:MAG TPA: SGNH/GDSL hydrolase family protein [Isosphaeraceae bacterium]|nr:SGNH/GDSL hydrolase family protein [Isosphaeraceae bacterium]